MRSDHTCHISTPSWIITTIIIIKIIIIIFKIIISLIIIIIIMVGYLFVKRDSEILWSSQIERCGVVGGAYGGGGFCGVDDDVCVVIGFDIVVVDVIVDVCVVIGFDIVVVDVIVDVCVVIGFDIVVVGDFIFIFVYGVVILYDVIIIIY